MKTTLCGLAIFCAFMSFANAQLQVAAAYCENKTDLQGADLKNLHFSWEATAQKNGQSQTAYQLVIASSEAKLKAESYDVFNSAVVRTGESVQVQYTGRALQPATTYYWRVRSWDKDSKVGGWSKSQHITTGLFSKDDWKSAKWIGYEQLPDSMRVAPAVDGLKASGLGNKALQRSVVPLFRKTFTTPKKVERALLFVTGLGQYEVSVNGSKISNAFMSPGWTYYDKSILYDTYDVTGFINLGKNAIAAIVGTGFYNINRERYFKLISAFGFPTMICRLKISFTDGSTQDIISDSSWKSAPSPIVYSSIFGGEDYDATKEQTGWDSASFDDAGWRAALLVTPPSGTLLPDQGYAINLLDTFSAKKISASAKGGYLYDFGQNASGIVCLKVKGRKGQVVRLTPSELLDKQQLPNQQASGGPYYFSYTLKGDGEEIWQPKFTYYGFRYVMVEGASPENQKDSSASAQVTDLTLLHNRNSNPPNGSFECSDKLFNRIHTLILWALKSNMQSVLTDCPHREKLGWLEVTYLMGNSIHYNFDIYHLYRKLVHDMMDAQYPNGLVPDIAPEIVIFREGFQDSPEWGSTSIILPWLLYSWYNDKQILQQAYPMMKKYARYLESKADDYILSHGLGDWYDYGPNPPGEAQLTPKALTATSIFYYDIDLLSRIAGALQNDQDSLHFSQMATKIKQRFNKKFYKNSTGVYSTGSQTAMSMPLSVGLVQDSDKKAVLKNLIDSIYANGKALTAGDIGFHFLIKALDDGGASQLIYDMNHREDVAGYGFQLKKGATALTESWAALEEVSNNHVMLGHIMEWFYSGLAGISQEEGSVGYKHIKIRPQPVGNVTSARGSFHSPYGWITTDWKKDKNTFTLDVHIPVNTIANVYIPASPDSKIYVNGKLSGKKASSTGNGTVMFTVGAGNFIFKTK